MTCGRHACIIVSALVRKNRSDSASARKAMRRPWQPATAKVPDRAASAKIRRDSECGVSQNVRGARSRIEASTLRFESDG